MKPQCMVGVVAQCARYQPSLDDTFKRYPRVFVFQGWGYLSSKLGFHS